METLVFPPLTRLPWLNHGFTTRQIAIEVTASRDVALSRLQERHRQIVESQGVIWRQLHLAEQVHRNRIVIAGHAGGSLSQPEQPAVAPGADGLITATAGVPLGIHVADCCAIFLVETRRRAIGLLHSGRKGTEAGIAREGVRRLAALAQGDPSAMISALSPCIHRCCYEVDFIGEIEQQLRAEGVGEIWRHPDCTGCHPERYYSYRKEKGQTGRMLAFMMIRPCARDEDPDGCVRASGWR
ncbi:MAG: polyphenol oxidase family protein [Verrucomicrobia bacterium]|nr:polyphenol oxidase family protein [Verrucomicrobiota bacterium]